MSSGESESSQFTCSISRWVVTCGEDEEDKRSLVPYNMCQWRTSLVFPSRVKASVAAETEGED